MQYNGMVYAMPIANSTHCLYLSITEYKFKHSRIKQKVRKWNISSYLYAIKSNLPWI